MEALIQLRRESCFFKSFIICSHSRRSSVSSVQRIPNVDVSTLDVQPLQDDAPLELKKDDDYGTSVDDPSVWSAAAWIIQ